MKGKFILDVKVRFKGGVLSPVPLFYQNSTRLRPRQPRVAAAGSPGRNIWRMGTGRKGGRGWIVCPGGEGEEEKLGRHERALGSALVELVGRPFAFLWKLSIIKT